MTRPTRQTRELACLALGHDDGDAPMCPASDETLLADLIREVQRLRVAAGEVEETVVDEQDRISSLGDVLADAAGDDPAIGCALAALDAVYPSEPDARVLARYVLDRLAEDGWQLTRRRP